MRKIIFILLVGWWTIGMPATVVSQDTLRLEQVIAAAIQHNYGILLAQNDSAAARIDKDLTWAAFVPSLNANAGKVWNTSNQRQEFQDGTERERSGVRSNTWTAAVNLNWTLFDGLRMFATRDKVEELFRLGELNIKNQVVGTIAEVSFAYYGIVRQKQQLRAIEEQMTVSEERVKLAEKKLTVGLGSKPELLQAKVDLNAQKAAKLQQETLILQLKEQLNQLTAMQLPSAFEVTESIPINSELALETIQNNIGLSNPGLLLARKNIDIALLSLKEQKASRWPTLSFNSAYNFSRLDNQTVVNPFAPLFSQNNGLNFGFSANIPIFNQMTVRRNIQQAEVAIRGGQLLYEDQRITLDVNVRNAFRDYEYQKQALVLEEENIEFARENVQIALERFRQGVSTYLELREAQKSLEDAFNRLIAARYNTKLAEIELLRLKGDLLR